MWNNEFDQDYVRSGILIVQIHSLFIANHHNMLYTHHQYY